MATCFHQNCHWLVLLLLLVLMLNNDYVNSSPMLYKKNTQDKYEADLVAVSSTVIPLTVLEVSYGVGGEPSESYKQAVLQKLRKKVLHPSEAVEDDQLENRDTLITIKTQKHHLDSKKAKVKGIITPSN